MTVKVIYNYAADTMSGEPIRTMTFATDKSIDLTLEGNVLTLEVRDSAADIYEIKPISKQEFLACAHKLLAVTIMDLTESPEAVIAAALDVPRSKVHKQSERPIGLEWA